MTRKTAKTKTPGSVRNIVLVRLYGLGNFILALPMIDAIETFYPKAIITLLVDPRCAKIARMTSGQRKIVLLDSDFDADPWFAQQSPDLTLFAYPCGNASLVETAAKYSKACVAHGVGDNQGMASVELSANPKAHETNLNLDLVRALGHAVKFSNPKITLPNSTRSETDRFAKKLGLPMNFVAFHPGCHPDLAIKRWAPKYYGALADRLHDGGFGVALVGGADEAHLATPIIKSSNAPIINLIGKTSLEQVAGILKKARLMVANDTGLMHLAAAIGTPVVGIYGPTSHQKNTPLIKAHRIVRRPVSCSPCYKPGCTLSPCKAWCLEMTTPQMVHRACMNLLSDKAFTNNKSHRPFVSVIVPTYNGQGKIGRLLDSLQKQTYPKDKFEVIVVDNNSSDGTKQEIQKHPWVRYEFYDAKQTSYGARNHGIEKARGEVFAFTDDDCAAEPDWIANAIQWFEHPDVGGVAGKVMGAQTGSDIAQWQTRRGFLDLDPDIETSMRPYVFTANVFYRKSLFDSIGLFDDSMISGGDFDFAMRMKATGRYLFRAGKDATTYHYHRESLKSLARVFFRYGYGSVNLDRILPYDEQSKIVRLANAGKDWKSLISLGGKFVLHGYSPSAVLGLYDLKPEDFFDRLRLTSPRYTLTAHSMPASRTLESAQRNGNRLFSLPLPPTVDFLDAAIGAVAAQKLPCLFLYGAGNHSRRLMRLSGFDQLSAVGIIDDKAIANQTMGGLPVVTLNQALGDGCKTILISTDAFERVLIPKLKYLKNRGIQILGLYNEEAFARFAKYSARPMLNAPIQSKAIYIPQNLLAEPLICAVAKALGIQIRLDETSNSRYSDEFLDWVITVSKRTGQICGSIRYGHLYV